jgi:hypothetical protein
VSRSPVTDDERKADRQRWEQQRNLDRQIEDTEQQVKLERARLELERLRASGQPSPLEPAPSQTGNTTKSSGNKGTRPGTLAAAAAIHRYLFDMSVDPSMKPAELARKAAEYATELGLPDADLLNPESSTMWQIAERLLDAHRHRTGR